MLQLGKYLLREPVASGGMADVYRAEIAGRDGFVKEVALKLVRAEHGSEDEFVRMFKQEAKLASRLRHANIVQVLDFDQWEGRWYIAMEYVHGRNLRRVQDRARELGLRLGVPRAVHIAAEVAKALAYAHRLEVPGEASGLVHRDVSPQNVLVSFEGEVKLTDFGIAHAMGAASLTQPGTLKGKMAYMAPEQARGEPVDRRADVFALGVVLWELCTGRRLFARGSELATLEAVTAAERIAPPSEWNALVPAELDAVVMGALERDRDRRTPGAQELATALSGALWRMVKDPAELDLRALMHRLWPEEATPPALRVREETAIRPDRGAAPQAGAGGMRVAGTAADDRAASRLAAEEAPASGPPTGDRAADARAARPPGLPSADEVGARAAVAGGPVASEVEPATMTVQAPRGTGRSPGGRPRLSRAGPALAALVVVAAAGWWALREAPPPVGPGAAPAAGRAPAEAGAPAASAGGERVERSGDALAPASPDRREGGTSQRGSTTGSAGPAASSPGPGPGAPAPPGAGRSGGAPGGVAPRGVVREARHGVHALPVPSPASGEGILFVNAHPWADVVVDGEPVGDTPVEVRVEAGRRRVRVAHPTYGAAEKDVEVEAGARATWLPRLDDGR